MFGIIMGACLKRGGGSASGTHLNECAAAQLSRRLLRVHEVVHSLQGKGSAVTAEGSEVARRAGRSTIRRNW